MYVNAGELDKRIEIYRKPEKEADGYVAEGSEPKLVRRCWAKVSQTGGTEMDRRGADLGEARIRFLIRTGRTPIDRKMFVRYRGKDYEILYVNGYGDTGEYTELWSQWIGTGVRYDTKTSG